MSSYAQFQVPQFIFYGRNSLQEIGKQAAAYGSKVLLISDNIMKELGIVEKTQKHLEDLEVSCVTYLDIDSEPTDIHISETLELFYSAKCDVIVGLGGGSCLDTAKAVSVLASIEGDMDSFRKLGKMELPSPIPLITVPTTAGSGSESTNVAVITDTRDSVKVMVKDSVFMPLVTIADPNLTVSLPPQVTAATGMDALCHAIEAYISNLAHPLTDIFALSAIELIFNNIQKAYKNGSDIEAREKMSLGAMQAGLAFSNSSVCLVHGMSRPVGAIFHVPHGISNAMLLPAVLEFTWEKAQERLAEIARKLDSSLDLASDKEASSFLISEIKGLCRKLEIPNIKTWGVDSEEFQKSIDKMAQDALDSGSPAKNPRIPDLEEIIDLYKYCYDYKF